MKSSHLSPRIVKRTMVQLKLKKSSNHQRPKTSLLRANLKPPMLRKLILSTLIEKLRTRNLMNSSKIPIMSRNFVSRSLTKLINKLPPLQ
jgi:hypothetical protein